MLASMLITAPSAIGKPAEFEVQMEESFVDCATTELRGCDSSVDATETGSLHMSSSVFNDDPTTATYLLDPTPRHRAGAAAQIGHEHHVKGPVDQVTFDVVVDVKEARVEHSGATPYFRGGVVAWVNQHLHMSCPAGGCTFATARKKAEIWEPNASQEITPGRYTQTLTVTGADGGRIKGGTKVALYVSGNCYSELGQTAGTMTCVNNYSVVDVVVR